MSEPLLEPVFRRVRMSKAGKHVKEGSVVFDVGCGDSGLFLKQIRKRIKFGVGVDKKVNDEKLDNIKLKQFVIEQKLSPEEHLFDHVTMLAVLEHLNRPESVLKEVYFMLREGGSLILTQPTPRSKKVLEFMAMLGLVSREEILDHKRYLPPEKIKAILSQIGFRNIIVEEFELGFNVLVIAFK